MRYWAMCIGIVCKLCCDVMNFEVNLIFLLKLFFLHDQNVVTKTLISWERKKLLRQNKKHFLSFLKVFNQANDTNISGMWESDFKLIFQKQPSRPRNMYTEHWRKLSNLIAFLEIVSFLNNSHSVERVKKFC